ncbi:MAG: PAS domain S-box protein, partial [Casimicrobiaceae bacterium]
MATHKDEQQELLRAALQNAAAVLQEREKFERELLQTRDELREREELLRAIFDQAAIGIAVAALDGTFLDANRKFSQLLGYSVDELRSQTFMDVTHPADLEESRRNIAALVSGTVADFRQEKRYVRKDGTAVWSRTTVTFLRDAAGNADRFIAAIEDITAHRDAEAALRDESRSLDLLNTTGMLLASTLNRETLLQATTDTATKLTGASFGAFFHNAATSENGESSGLYTISGAEKETFTGFGDPRATQLLGPTFRGEAPIRCDDILTDLRYGKSGPYHG